MVVFMAYIYIGVTNYLLNGMIIQAGEKTIGLFSVKVFSQPIQETQIDSDHFGWICWFELLNNSFGVVRQNANGVRRHVDSLQKVFCETAGHWF